MVLLLADSLQKSQYFLSVLQCNGGMFTRPSYQTATGWDPVWVFLSRGGKKKNTDYCPWFVFCVSMCALDWRLCILGLASLPVFPLLATCMSIYMCLCVRARGTNHCMIYTIFLCRRCLGPTLCHGYAQRSLCNWNGPLKAPCHMEPSSLGCLYVHPSISFNCPVLGFWAVTYLLGSFSIG